MSENGMVRVSSTGLAQFEPQDFNDLARLATMCARSRLFAVTDENAAMVIMMTGASLGLSPVTALRGVHVVQGRAVLSSDLLVAVVLRSGQCEYWRPLEIGADRCTIETKRKGAEPVRHTWTIDDAKRAKLTGKGTWEQFPKAMLRARCSADLARMVYPDVLFGVYVEGELEETAQTVTVERDGGAQPEPEDDGADGSRAFAAYTEALMTATDATSIRRLYHALVENLRAEGKDPVEFTNGDDGAGALAHKRLDAIGLTLTRDERNALLAFHAPTQPLTEHEGPRVAYWCDAILGAVRAFPEATGDDRVKICATWWLSHRAEAQAETSRVLNMVRAILARVSAGMRVADISPHTSSKAKERLAAAIAELIGQPPPDGPQGGGKPPLKPAPASAQGDTRETTTAPKATAGEAWTRSAEAMRDHLAQQVTDVVHLERSARKHGAAVLATSYGVELYAQRYQALTHDGDSARRLEDCRTAVESWMRAGPVRKAPVIPLRKHAPQPMGRTGT